jgi:hypothetical protein
VKVEDYVHLANFKQRGGSATLSPSIPGKMIERAGGLGAIETIELSENARVHRQLSGARWRNPVNGRRNVMTSRFASAKNHGRRIQCDSGGEKALFRFVEIYPPIRSYLEQVHIIEIDDEQGTVWAIPEAFIEVTDETFGWIEGKYAAALATQEGTNYIEPSLSDKVANRLARIERALSDAGYPYYVVNEFWARHPILAANVDMIFANRVREPTQREIDELSRLLRRGDTIVDDCLRAFPGREYPEEYLCAAMARGFAEIDISIPFGPRSAVFLPRPLFWFA